MKFSAAALVILVMSGSVPAAPKRAPAASVPVIVATPLTVSPGKTTEIRFRGEEVGTAVGLWTNFGGEVHALRPSDRGSGKAEARYEVTLPSDASVGIGAVRLQTTKGVSSVQLVMVDDLPTVSQKTGNHSPREAQPIEGAGGVDGTCEPQSLDFYRVHGNKGEHISIEVVAQRLGSKMDSILRVLDSAGRELAYNDDAPGAGSDSRLAFTFPADGDYYIELHDVNYEGGPDYRYHLRLGVFPLITSVFPLAGKRGTTARFHLESAGPQPMPSINFTLPSDRARTFIHVKGPSGTASAFVPVLCTDCEERVESEPNDTPLTGTRIPVPSSISAHLDAPGDRDFYEFQAKRGDHLAIRAQSRSIGSTANLWLRLMKSDGSLLRESKPTGTDEGAIDATVPGDGVYRLLVEGLAGGGGPGMFYRLDIEPVRPGFELSVDSDKVEAAADGTFKIAVTATRHDFDGPITLTLGGDGVEWEVTKNTIPKGKTQATLQGKVSKEAKIVFPSTITVLGQALVNGAPISEMASAMPALKKLFPRMPMPPVELEGLIGVGLPEGQSHGDADAK